jgi:hypothetical protein
MSNGKRETRLLVLFSSMKEQQLEFWRVVVLPIKSEAPSKGSAIEN